VTGALDLRVVAECANTGVSRIQMLNPELRRLATPAGRTYQVKVPTGSGGSTRECLDAIPAERRVTFRTHVLRKGETLSALARMYGSRPQDIAAANGLATSKRLARGTELIIPVPPPAASAKAASTTPVKTATTTVNPTASRASSQRVRVNYRVKSGDTLTRIAARFNTTVRSLLSWNKGVRASRIEAGDLLTVYAHGGRD
jgi:membrane-bound lytic murein transglycosylase D